MFEHISSHIKVDKEVQFSDGCSAWFKSKVPFLHLTETSTHKMEIAFLGSHHEKSRHVMLLVELSRSMQKHTSENEREQFSPKKHWMTSVVNLWLCTQMRNVSMRKVFFYVEEFPRCKLQTDIKTLKGTRQIHHISGVAPGAVQSKFLSCFARCIWAPKKESVQMKHTVVRGNMWEYHFTVL